MEIVTGEKLQEMADIYLGFYEEYSFNPYIYSHKNKIVDMRDINGEFNNPKYIFCYPNRLLELFDKLHYFLNDFVLITHNSDYNIEKNDVVLALLNSSKIIKWYGQNVCFEHDKLFFLPIGIANRQWEHGHKFISYIRDVESSGIVIQKSKKIYMNFQIWTNKEKRQICYDVLSNKIPFLSSLPPYENIHRMAEYEFCICPEGNGMDTHRFWESIYLKVVPIVISNPLIEIIRKNTNLPMVILTSWDAFNYNELPLYESFNNCWTMPVFDIRK